MPEDIRNITWPEWETTRMIGRGSFGTVYEIQKDVMGSVEKAALKVISIPQNSADIEELYGDGYNDESIKTSFQHHVKSIIEEYSLMRRLNNCPNIVHCDDVRCVAHCDSIGWDIFIKMELLVPLTKSLPDVISEDIVLKIAKDICTALVACSKYKILHRDIKPQNIFYSSQGDYKLGDFGIAKTVEQTMGGTKIGTYKYMAPEVYNNQPYGESADVYSLGLVLYWLLNERRAPFLPTAPAKITINMDSEARARRFTGEQLPSPVHGSEKFKKIVLKACAFKPEDRYHTAEEMLTDLLALEKDEAPLDKMWKAPQGYKKPILEKAISAEEKKAVCTADVDEQDTLPGLTDTETPVKQQQQEVPKEKYTIKFVDEDYTPLATTVYDAGAAVTIPEVADTDRNGDIYIFERWVPAVSWVAEKSVTYRAVYKKKIDQAETGQAAPASTAVRKPFNKKWIAAVAALAVTFCIVWSLKAGSEQIPEDTMKDDTATQIPTTGNVIATNPQSGEWKRASGKMYYIENGVKCTGFKVIDGSIYYFDKNGVRQTGFKVIDGETYYFNSISGVMRTGWLPFNNEKYYFKENGQMATGNCSIEGERYWFDSDGRLTRKLSQ